MTAETVQPGRGQVEGGLAIRKGPGHAGSSPDLAHDALERIVMGMAQDVCVIVGAEDYARLAAVAGDRSRPLMRSQPHRRHGHGGGQSGVRRQPNHIAAGGSAHHRNARLPLSGLEARRSPKNEKTRQAWVAAIGSKPTTASVAPPRRPARPSPPAPGFRDGGPAYPPPRPPATE